jgi:hypothetical protein
MSWLKVILCIRNLKLEHFQTMTDLSVSCLQTRVRIESDFSVEVFHFSVSGKVASAYAQYTP